MLSQIHIHISIGTLLGFKRFFGFKIFKNLDIVHLFSKLNYSKSNIVPI